MSSIQLHFDTALLIYWMMTLWFEYYIFSRQGLIVFWLILTVCCPLKRMFYWHYSLFLEKEGIGVHGHWIDKTMNFVITILVEQVVPVYPGKHEQVKPAPDGSSSHVPYRQGILEHAFEPINSFRMKYSSLFIYNYFLIFIIFDNFKPYCVKLLLQDRSMNFKSYLYTCSNTCSWVLY